MSLLVWVGVGALGGAGACARVVLELEITRRAHHGWPWGHFVVNVSGALALGVLGGAGVGGDALLLAGTALLGAYTTFSAWMLDCLRLARAGHLRGLALNLAGSLGAGLGAAAFGWWLAS